MQPTACAIRPSADDGDPSSPLTDPQISLLSGGTELHRVHRTTFRAAKFNPGGGGQTRIARFNDTSGTPVPFLQASATFPSAVHEGSSTTFLYTR